MFSTRSDGVASSCAGGDEDDFSSDGEGPTLNIVKKREKQAGDQVDGLEDILISYQSKDV